MITITLLLSIILIASCPFVNMKKLYDKNSRYYRFLLYSSTAIGLIYSRVKVEVKGLEKLPEGRFLLVANHKSKFDPIVTWHAMRKYDLAYISKKENFSIPVFGRIIRRNCFMDINRKSPRSAVKTVNHAAKLIKDGIVSVGVYPEGTRNNGEGLLPFHSGIFLVATKSDAPVVIAATENTEKIRINFPRKTVVTLNILDVISSEEVKGMTTKELSERSYNTISEFINGNRSKTA